MPDWFKGRQLKNRVKALRAGDVVFSKGGAEIKILEIRGDDIDVSVKDTGGKVHGERMNRLEDFGKVDWIDRIERPEKKVKTAKEFIENVNGIVIVCKFEPKQQGYVLRLPTLGEMDAVRAFGVKEPAFFVGKYPYEAKDLVDRLVKLAKENGGYNRIFNELGALNLEFVDDKRVPPPSFEQPLQHGQRRMPKTQSENPAKETSVNTSKERRLWTELSPDEQKLVNEVGEKFPEQNVGKNRLNIIAAIDKKTKLEGLPDTAGPTDAYFLPIKGSGGFGMVREIFFRNAKGELVVRLIKSSLDPRLNTPVYSGGERGIQDEISKLSLVHSFGEHPNLMKVNEKSLKDENGREFLLLEKAGDVSGFDYIRQPAMHIDKALRLIFQVMDGLNFLHSNGCMHRDLKWDNTMVDSTSGNLRIIDFGTISALPNPATKALKELHDKNVSEPMATTPSIFDNSNLGFALYDEMQYGKTFRAEYDYLAVFQMIVEAEGELSRSGIPPSVLFLEMSSLAQNGIAAHDIDQLSVVYIELQKLRAQNP